MSGHTPGPWLVGDEEIVFADPDDISYEQYTVAITGDVSFRIGWSPRPGEGAANARLIAAAPDLLTALLRLADDYERLIGDGFEMNPPLVLLAARAAIAKAEGK